MTSRKTVENAIERFFRRQYFLRQRESTRSGIPQSYVRRRNKE